MKTTTQLFSEGKAIFIAIALVFSTVFTTAQCPPGNLSLANQAQVNFFGTNYPTCTTINGNVSIQGGNSITDLSPLSGITTINGSLLLGPLAVNSFTAFSNLTHIGDSFRINNIDGVTDLSGFEGLTSIGGYINIGNSDGLTSLDGFHNLTAVGGAISLRNNDGLTDISALSNINPASITATDGLQDIRINNNDNLSMCSIASICGMFNIPGKTFNINNNSTGCDSVPEVENNCFAACPIPTGFTVSEVGMHTAKFTVDPHPETTKFDFRIGQNSYDVNGFPLNPNYGMNNKNNPYTKNSLHKNKTYKVYVRADCGITKGVGDNILVSPWSAPVMFTTLPSAMRMNDDVRISVYPNPVSDVVTISGIDVKSVQIFDQTGKYLHQFSVKNNSINLSQLPAGRYFIQIIDLNGVSYNQQILKN